MFKFSKRAQAPSSSDFEHSVMHSAANSSQGAGDVQRELIRVAFIDTLRATGVPAQWLDCDVIYIQSPRHGEQVQVQLIIKKWSGLLLRHSLAFQRELANCLDRYEPHVDHSKHEWTWKFADDCDTPYPGMPAPEEWGMKLQASQAKATAAAKQPAPANVGDAVNAARVVSRVPSRMPTPAAAPQPAKAFELRDIFSDLTVEQLKTK
jgi:hypothetical protein